MVGLIVPRLAGDPPRDAAWSFVRRRYEALHPDLDVIEADGVHTQPWTKTGAVNRAVEECDHEVLVIADADLIVGAGALARAVDLSRTGWAVPHSTVYRLDKDRTQAVLDGPVDVDPCPVIDRHLSRKAYYGHAGGGVVVIARWAWTIVGGFDERFDVWGGEDVSLGWALRTLVGPGLRIHGPLWHLWHPQQSSYNDARFAEGMRLTNRYRQAAGNPDAMNVLLLERDG